MQSSGNLSPPIVALLTLESLVLPSFCLSCNLSAPSIAALAPTIPSCLHRPSPLHPRFPSIATKKPLVYTGVPSLELIPPLATVYFSVFIFSV
ncbi:hypothetical protein ZWY2020_016254 [Hordeum vulgare]|nr:hypothetical protein ZWY2020_016254 [Hordeum vulgare]